ncbi:hypothetical protein AGMMS49991_08370 [Spirochaetia bacterium]|nr:hypothetical protein AGMMS49991_08370 [Spirochaetia bacterium]
MEQFWTEKQQENLQYFQENLESWASDPLYKLKHVVIHNQKVCGVYDTFENALSSAVQTLPQGEFVIQQIITDQEVVSFLCSATKVA